MNNPNAVINTIIVTGTLILVAACSPSVPSLQTLAQSCSVTDAAGVPVKFYATPIPSTYNVTSKEVCDLAGN
ncbi:MAG: hypothetical protein MN733_02495, partial [Nitrososphaera sp.]|nr:hypothetical protein [Nitrososphaera sp.]